MKILLGTAFLIVILTLSFFAARNEEPPMTLEHAAEEKKPALDTLIVPEETPLSLSVSPVTILQGEPALIIIEGIDTLSDIQSLTLDDKPLPVHEENGRFSALVGIDLNRRPGSYSLVLATNDQRTLEQTLTVSERTRETTDFDIPESFGGNTTEGQKELADNWADDTKTLNAITAKVTPEKHWEGAFRYPLEGTPVITDTYGYNRETGAVNLSHNGTDFRAAVGTPVYAMNAGTIVFNGSFKNYGNTVIIDHGLGLMTMYMHLSKVLVEESTQVKRGDLIAESGNTGYSLGPHLHLSVRIGGYSIDPEKFLALMGE